MHSFVGQSERSASDLLSAWLPVLLLSSAISAISAITPSLDQLSLLTLLSLLDQDLVRLLPNFMPRGLVNIGRPTLVS